MQATTKGGQYVPAEKETVRDKNFHFMGLVYLLNTGGTIQIQHNFMPIILIIAVRCLLHCLIM